jgi:penicillin-binding protein 1A
MKGYLDRLYEGLKFFFLIVRAKLKSLYQKFRVWFAHSVEYLDQHKKIKWALIITGIPFLVLFALLSIVLVSTPGKEELRAFRNPVPSEVYTADSVLIGRYFIQDRSPLKYEEISSSVIDAVISTEDVRFFNHSGIDLKSLGRVVVKSILLQDESSGGGSTVTQQLAKNIFPRRDYWLMSILMNKLREAVIAVRLENIYSKQELLTLYLNTVPFADNTYGIQSAAQRFFSCDASKLLPEQAAVLIGMLKATHNYNPRLFPKNSRLRRNVVLAQMRKYNLLSGDKVDSLQKLPLKLKLGEAKHQDEIAPYFKQYLKTILLKWCENHTKADGSPYNLYIDGLKIFTTLDSRLQVYAEKAVTRQMTDLQKQFFDHWGKEKPWKENENVIQDAIRRTPRYKKLKEDGLSEKAILQEMSKPTQMRLFTWNGGKQANVSPIDSIKHHLQYLNAGFLAMEPSTGEVKAWVGGIEYGFYQYDHVKESTKRQVGSIFKPIVYATAIEEGVSPCEFIPAGQQTYVDEEGQLWTPRNSQFDYPVQYSMRGALAYSVNTVAVKLINRAGINNTIKLARNMGIHSEIPDVPSIALGSSAISLMEMTAAYACLVNDGVTSYPYFITAIEDHEGKVFSHFKSDVSGKRALSRETAQLVRQMLQTVVYEGTASRLRWKYGVYNDVAAKTGTTQANADGWFMAMTPKLVMGSWVGADDPRIRFRNTNLGQGSNTSLPIVAYFLRQINEDAAYREIAKAKFPALPDALRKQLNCDLYELDEDLKMAIEKSVQARDSLMQADTTGIPPPETFLQTLYNRKRKIALLSEEETKAHAANSEEDKKNRSVNR